MTFTPTRHDCETGPLTAEEIEESARQVDEWRDSLELHFKRALADPEYAAEHGFTRTVARISPK